MLRSLTFIKTLHSLVFFVLSAANLMILYAALAGRVTTLALVAVAFVVGEGVVLMFNGWRCPLRIYAEQIGAVSGQVTDIFLPKWFADRIFSTCTGLLAFSVIVILARYFGARLGLFAPLQFVLPF